MRRVCSLVAMVAIVTLFVLGPPGGGATAAHAAELRFGVVSPNLKVRPAQRPPVQSGARLFAGRNEFEAFQVVFSSSGGSVDGIGVLLSQPLSGPGGATLPADSVTLYRADYYEVGTASNTEGAAGRWPDPLIPDLDPIVGERRNAFPFRVPAAESRVVWVDIFVPATATAGRYTGELAVTVSGSAVGTLPIELQVGDFTLPSTASLRSAFAMDFDEPCMAHTGTESCDPRWNERKALELRERYVRCALDHRFTIHDPFFQPPVPGSIEPFEELMLPLVLGSGRTRLRGARLTAIRLGGDDFATWLGYARRKGFADRLFYYPVDEPHGQDEWKRFATRARALHAADPAAKTILTTTLREATAHGVAQHVDIFVPVINFLEERPNAGTPYDGNQRPSYEAWLAADPKHELWSYQSCQSHGCGECGTPSPNEFERGWPLRVIDGSAIQNRAFAWIAFTHDIGAELYFETVEQLGTAWARNGQCKYSGSGDGTLLYPGKPSRIGGKTDIPIESMRLKLLREGMEDYEYLVLAAGQDQAEALAIARALFPHPYETAQPPERLDEARARLYAMIDGKAPPPGAASGGSSVTVPNGRDGGATDEDPAGPSDKDGLGARSACAIGGDGAAGGPTLLLAGLLLLARRRRRQRARDTRRRRP
jgi:MYXO-CTERM domain-containing protein